MTFLSFSCLVAFLGLPIWCWMEVDKVYVLALFLILMKSIQSFTIKYYVVLSCFTRVWLSASPRTIARQSPLFLGFSRQEYWSGLPCSPLGNHPYPGVEPESPALQIRHCWATGEVLNAMLPVLCWAYLLNCIWLFATPWDEAHQLPLPMRTLQARILKWIAMPSSRGSPQSRDQTCISGSLSLVPPGKP